MNELPKGILFDLDDTIIAFDAVADPTWRRICAEHSKESDLFTFDELYETVKEVNRWYWSDPLRHKIGRQKLEESRREIVALAFKKLNVNAPLLANKIADDYSIKRDEAIEFFPGAEKTLLHLFDSGVKLALITNGEAGKQRRKVERFKLDRFFSTILIEGELGYGKPEEGVYLLALKDLDLKSEDVWSVGDRLEWDIEVPQRLGIYSIWNDFRKKGLPDSSSVVPDRIIHSISELI
jgi:putative hydrolase of the HAD superfamily